MPYSNKKSIVLLGAVLESVLALIFFVWAFLTEFEYSLVPTGGELVWGVVLTFPLFVFNWLIFEFAVSRFRALGFLRKFVSDVVTPLAKLLDRRSSLLLSVCAGVGEELFFRGILQNEFGLLVASVLFSVLHFGTALKDYKAVAVLYALVGGYLGVLYLQFNSLWVPIIAHVVYDFVALEYVRARYQSGSLESLSNL